MQLTPDNIIYFTIAGFPLNATIVNTWIVMAILVAVSYFATRNWYADRAPSPWRNALEVIVKAIEQQVEEISSKAIRPVVYFAGTLFLFIALANLMIVIPGFRPPTGSLSTTVALTITVICAVPLFSISHHGVKHYLSQFVKPTWVMLPLNIIAEFSRAISLSVRLYGNIMSGAVIAAILLAIAPFFFPIVMELLSLLTGMIQAYIFAILATVYIASAMAEPQQPKLKRKQHD